MRKQAVTRKRQTVTFESSQNPEISGKEKQEGKISKNQKSKKQENPINPETDENLLLNSLQIDQGNPQDNKKSTENVQNLDTKVRVNEAVFQQGTPFSEKHLEESLEV